MKTGLRAIFVLFALHPLVWMTFAAETPTPVTSLVMPIPLDHLRPITVENADQVIELGWFREFYECRICNLTYTAKLSHTDSRLAVGWSNGLVTVRDTSTGERLAVLTHKSSIHEITFSPDDRYLATSESDYPKSTVHIWDMTNFTEYSSFEVDYWVGSLSFNADSKLLAISPRFGDTLEIQIHDLETKDILHTIPADDDTTAAFTPDGKVLVVNFAGKITGYDTSKFEKIYTASGEYNNSIDFNIDGSLLVNPNSAILDTKTGAIISYAQLGFWKTIFGSDNRLVVAFSDGGIKFWDTKTDQIISEIKDNQPSELEILAANDQRTLFVASHLVGDVHLYGAPECAIWATKRTNLRTGSGANNPVGGALQKGDLGFVIGKQEDGAGAAWWKLSNNLWVRSDIVETVSGCQLVPEIEK